MKKVLVIEGEPPDAQSQRARKSAAGYDLTRLFVGSRSQNS